jgi:hypothetical protein
LIGFKGGKMKLYLTEKDFLGKGTYRRAYQHPEDITKCIKISIESSQDRDTRDELRYRKICKKTVEQSKLLTKYYGTVETNLGTGHVFELVRDYDGMVSQSFRSLLQREKDSPMVYDLLQKLKKNLFEELILVRPLWPGNILIQRITEQESQVRIIDDIGMHQVLIPLPYFSKTIRKYRLEKRWKDFLKLLQERYGINIEHIN